MLKGKKQKIADTRCKLDILTFNSLVDKDLLLGTFSFNSTCCLPTILTCAYYIHVDKRMFGVPLSANVRHIGQALPPLILHAMQYLRENDRLKSLGLFRRGASKSRVDLLREVAEADPGKT